MPPKNSQFSLGFRTSRRTSIPTRPNIGVQATKEAAQFAADDQDADDEMSEFSVGTSSPAKHSDGESTASPRSPSHIETFNAITPTRSPKTKSTTTASDATRSSSVPNPNQSRKVILPKLSKGSRGSRAPGEKGVAKVTRNPKLGVMSFWQTIDTYGPRFGSHWTKKGDEESDRESDDIGWVEEHYTKKRKVYNSDESMEGRRKTDRR